MRTIRTEIADRIEAITPGTLPADPFVRWRPDREPTSCRFAQLDVAAPVSFASLFD